MEKKLKITVGLCCFAILFVYFVSSFAQNRNIPEDDQKQTTEFSKNIKAEGWDIPDISNARLIDSDILEVQGLQITRRLFRLKARTFTKIDFYSLDSTNSKIVETKDLAIIGITVYSYKEQIYAYEIKYIPYGFTISGDSALGGAPINIFYEDGNGDGKFEIRYELPDFPTKVPDWVTKVKN